MSNRTIPRISLPAVAHYVSALLLLLFTQNACGINVVLDYTYDTYGFYSTSTTNGQKARATVEAAANYFSDILTDTFSAITVPDPYVGQLDTLTWSWNISLFNPSGSGNLSIANPSFAADEFRIYLGANYFSGSTLGEGGPGGWGYQTSSTTGQGFFQNERNAINAITDDFDDAIRNRGETSGFANWGGAVSFDIDTNWNYDHTVAPTSGQRDLYSVALHEFAHVFGLGGSDEWNAFVSGGFFTGQNVQNEYGGVAPLSTNTDHFAENTMSRVFGGTDNQEALMDPNITVGTRKVLTSLDAAALSDLGWDVFEPAIPTLAGDYNDDGIVNAADFTVYRDNWNSTTELAADGSGNGIIDIADYNVWVTNYGNTSSSSSAATAVPEPASLLLSTLALVGFFTNTRSIRR